MRKGFAFAVIPDVQLGYTSYCSYDQLVYLWDRLTRGAKEGVVGEEIETRLLAVVNLINSIPEIEFVITVGDLTQEGLPEQVSKVKEILDKLDVPWVPTLGNHDLLPYSVNPHWGGKPKGIELFERIFRETFQRLSGSFKEWRKPSSEETLLNFGFTHGNVRFIVVDNVNRRQTPFSKRSQMAFLSKKSSEWLQNQLSRSEERKVVVSHSPLTPWLLMRGHYRRGSIINIAGHWHEEIRFSIGSLTTLVTSSLYLKPVIPVVRVLPDEVQFHSEKIV